MKCKVTISISLINIISILIVYFEVLTCRIAVAVGSELVATLGLGPTS
jgi:hypothetical protein